MRRLVMVAILAVCACVPACAPPEPAGIMSRGRVRVTVSPRAVGDIAGDPTARRETRRFYERRDGRPAWVRDWRITSTGDAIVEAALRAGEDGLDPAEYDATDLLDARAGVETLRTRDAATARAFADVDARLTYTLLRLAAHLAHGRVPRGAVLGPGTTAADIVAPRALLERAAAGEGIRSLLEEIAPRHAQYGRLRDALARARAGFGAGLPHDAADPSWRVRQLELNLERWRWLPRRLGPRHILVNVPAYALQAVDDYRPVLAMRVVVGDPRSPTPLFSDTLSHVVFSPYWNIPDRILRDETLAAAAADPDYLARAGIEVLRTNGPGAEPVDPGSIDWTADPAAQGFRFRQLPGTANALGLVKFMFPNRFNVYLHDTPETLVFDREQRAYSHGCVRVEDPVSLAAFALQDQAGWSRPRIVAAMHAGREEVATLSQPIPVHLGYWTTWVEADGTVAFLDDPYGIDARHDAALRRPGRGTMHAE